MRTFVTTAIAATAAAFCTPYSPDGVWDRNAQEHGVWVKYYMYGTADKPSMPVINESDFSGREGRVDLPSIAVQGGIMQQAGRSEHLMGVFDGYIWLEAGTWEFGTQSDDGSLLFIEGQKIVDNDGLHGTQDAKGSFTAPVDGLYDLRAQYYNNSGAYNFYASLGGPGVPFAQMPQERLFFKQQCAEDLPECTNGCWDGSVGDKLNDCACPEEPAECAELCWDESVADKFNNCACPEEPPECAELCWDGSVADKFNDCACPESTDWTGYEQVRTEWDDYGEHDDLEGANIKMADWYDTKVKPKLEEHRDFVYRYWLGMAEKDKDPLLDTCKLGTQCRLDNEERLKKELQEQWQKIIKNFRDDVQTQVLKTEHLVNDGWDVAVQCQIDHPCCEFSETKWDNIQKVIESHVNKITDKQKQVQELERRINEMKEKCEEYNLPWATYDQTAAALDQQTAAAGTEVEDEMKLDEEIDALFA